MSWGEITDEGIAEAGSLINVPLRRDRMQWIETASRDAIRHFAWGIGDNNPLWFDKDYGRTSPYGKNIAPPCILYAVDNTVVAPKLPGVQWIYAGTKWQWFEPIFMDDSFRAKVRLLRQERKSGRRFPSWVLQTGEIRFFNQHERLVAIALAECARTPRGDKLAKTASSEKTAPKAPYCYTADKIAEIEQQILNEPRTGAQPLYYEDVQLDTEIPQIVRGPLSIIDIMAWYSAQQGAQPYGGVHGDALRYRQRHADYHINKATGARESAGRGHLEARTGGDVGMGGAYDIGPQRISWAQHMLTNWIGDHGFLRTLDVAVRKPNLIGDTVWWGATATGKYMRDGYGIVELSLKATNQEGELSASGSASVILPSRETGPVHFPVPATV